jgi:hypothetical protein
MFFETNDYVAQIGLNPVRDAVILYPCTPIILAGIFRAIGID